MNFVKNLNLRKRLASFVTAFVLMATPALAKGESNKEADTRQTSGLVKQEEKVIGKSLTVTEFSNLVTKCYNYSSQFFNYPEMRQDIENLLYLMNHLYMNEDDNTEQFLIENGYINAVNMSEGKFEAILSANQFLNVRADYNQSKIRETSNPDDLLDLSEFCFDKSDKEALHDMFVLWVRSHLNNTFDNFIVDETDSLVNPEEFEDSNIYQLFKMLTTLNGMEGLRNASDLQAGAKFGAQVTFGTDLMQVIYDYLFTHYEKDLGKYFDKQGLVSHQLIRNDVPTDKCTLLGCLVDIYCETQYICLEQSLPDLFKSFEKESCKTK